MPFSIRQIEQTDIEQVLEIYRPYVERTIISFEYEVPSLEEFSNRVQTNTTDYPWLVCECNGRIVGYAYGSRHRYRTAYQWSPEATVYMNEDYHRQGLARVLYQTLFALLKLQGYVNVYAGIGLPNEKSEGFHKALGFDEIGVFKKIGYKMGKWHDTKWLQLHLVAHMTDPAPPRSFAEVEGIDEYKSILEKANAALMQGKAVDMR
jgi:phosphinothricin acetyltransferase